MWSISNDFFFLHKEWKLRLKKQRDMTVQIFNKLYVDKSVSRGNGCYGRRLIIYKLIVLMKRNVGVLELASICSYTGDCFNTPLSRRDRSSVFSMV